MPFMFVVDPATNDIFIPSVQLCPIATPLLTVSGNWISVDPPAPAVAVPEILNLITPPLTETICVVMPCPLSGAYKYHPVGIVPGVPATAPAIVVLLILFAPFWRT